MFLITTVTAAVAIASGALFAVGHHSARTDPVADIVADIPASRPAARLEQARQNMILLASASRSMNVVGTPKLATNPAPAALPATAAGSAVAAGSTAPVVDEPAPDPGTAQSIAYNMLASFGWSAKSQYGCLDNIWTRESGWRYNAENASGAYGIPQALPGSKMASAGADWETNPATQIKWGLGYIQGRYGSPCDAWGFWQSNGWY
jgi:hypothetical protein